MTDEERRLAQGFVARAKEELAAVENDLGGGFIARSVGGSYYAVLYAVKALLATRGLQTNRHSAAMRLFGREFVAPGLMGKEHSRTMGLLLERRLSAHYDVDPAFTEDKAREHLDQARNFVADASAPVSYTHLRAHET